MRERRKYGIMPVFASSRSNFGQLVREPKLNVVWCGLYRIDLGSLTRGSPARRPTVGSLRRDCTRRRERRRRLERGDQRRRQPKQHHHCWVARRDLGGVGIHPPTPTPREPRHDTHAARTHWQPRASSGAKQRNQKIDNFPRLDV